MTHAPQTELLTTAERSNFQQTGRADEVEQLCETFARHWPDAVRTFEYGRSAEGRPMRALIASRAGTLAPDEIARRDIPVLMLQGGIHPGESDGKDAGFIALRELLDGGAALGALDRMAILFVPAFNVDGHERFGRWNRPNQNGPEVTGWRATARNLNLNRDYTKADAPEMQAMLRLLNEWDPLICADMHVTDGADFEPDISIQVEPINQGAPQLYASGVQLRDELIAKLAAQGSLPLPYYPDFAEVDNPASGFQLTVYSPRFSTGYFPARNRFTVLVETHSWKTYAMRVRATRNAIIGLAELVVAHGGRWLQEAKQCDARDEALGGTELPLDYATSWREPTTLGTQAKASVPAVERADNSVSMIDFRGYAYTRRPSEISGSLVTEYDPTTPQIWHVPLRLNTTPLLVALAPRRGYLICAAYAQEIGAKLRLHGIELEPFTSAAPTNEVEVFRATHAEFSRTPFEGRMRVTLAGVWRRERQELASGRVLVPIQQRRARLVMALLEPQAPDSFAAWGFFNGHFEQKEHIEPYVAEQIARQMLARDSELADQFQRKLASDAAFAANPQARLEFFLNRHESRDERLNVYPIYKL